MTISLSLFLYIYYFLLAIWGIFSLIGVFHMMRFGFRNFATFSATFIFIAISFLILSVSFAYISEVDWTYVFTVFAESNPGPGF